MRLGIISDTHDDLQRTRFAVRVLQEAGAEALIHCGDLSSPPIVSACAALPFWFVFGNHDADSAAALEGAAAEFGAVCLGWSGMIELGGKLIGIAHGHLTTDVTGVLAREPDYFLFGHTHVRSDDYSGTVRRINPGALFRADEFTVAILEPSSGQLETISIPRYPGLSGC